MKFFIQSGRVVLLILIILQGIFFWSEEKIDPLFKSYNYDYLKKLNLGFSLADPSYPGYISGISGFSAAESWGRWTDSNVGVSSIHFNPPLPKKFILEIKGSAYGPNSKTYTKIVCGNELKEIVISEGEDKIYTVPFNYQERGCDSIQFIPPSPITPESFEGVSGDKRNLGLRLISLRIKTILN